MLPAPLLPLQHTWSNGVLCAILLLSLAKVVLAQDDKEYPCPRGTRLLIDEAGEARATKIDRAVSIREIRSRDWNRVRVVAQGNHFRFSINGRLASEFTDNARQGRLDQGAIALQIHDRGTRVEFKDIRLKRLAENSVR